MRVAFRSIVFVSLLTVGPQVATAAPKEQKKTAPAKAAPTQAENDAAPVASGAGCRATALAAGEAHTCAVVNGAVKCWGSNRYGQIGNDDVSTSPAPVTEVIAKGVKSVAAGLMNTCAIVGEGEVKCWGENTLEHTDQTAKTPTAMPGGLSGVKEVAVGGSSFACALLGTGQVRCWQDWTNPKGTDRVGMVTGVTHISVGGLVCGIVDGAAKCGGYHDAPKVVPGLTSGVTSISAGREHACAVVGGGVKCWGTNEYGQLGNGAHSVSGSAPAFVVGLKTGVQSVHVGGDVSCAVLTTGAVKCWGDGANGGTGTGAEEREVVAPKDVIGLSSGVVSVSVHSNYTGNSACALLTTGKVKCWGRNDSGQLGNGSTSDALTPVDVNLCE
jgi:alpha-tubulin suppressor-like RCC1 family protein